MKKLDLRPGLAAFLVMMGMALTSSGISYFVTSVCSELSVSRAGFTFYYSIMLTVNMIVNPFHGQILRSKSVRSRLLMAAAWNGVVFLLFACAGRLWHFYVIGALLGMFSNSFLSLCASVIVQRSYSGAQAATAMGIVMAGSGAGGICLSILLTAVVERLGWRAGYVFLSLFWVVLLLSAALLLGGEKQLAAEKSAARGEGMTREEALRSPVLYLILILMFLLGYGCSVQQQIPAVLSDLKRSAGQISGYMTVFSVALALGKAFQGWLYGRVGVKWGGRAVILCYAISYLCFRDTRLIYPALILLAVGMGTVTTMMSLLGRELFGTRDYAAIWSIVMIPTSLSVIVGAPIWGRIYDMTGSYRGGMAGVSLMLLAALALQVVLTNKKKSA